jgi:hypothetical protein
VVAAVAPLVGCNAVVRGQKLSDRPERDSRGMFLSTGRSPRPYRTLGFAQIMGEGRTYAGMVDVGEAGFDAAIRGALAQEAIRMGGDGVIHIEFLDENPPTTYERYQEAAQAVQSFASGQGQTQERRRTVVVTGEIIKFLD